MPETIPSDSVGVVAPQQLAFDEELPLDCGRSLDQYEIVYETYGELNAERSNAVLVCHALSGDHHAAGYHESSDQKPGWWETCIGPGKPIDTRRFFVVSPNNIGSCQGSTGPNSINPQTGSHYGLDFPIVTCGDWARAQRRLMQALGIERWAAVVGPSLGGMQVMQWAIDYPDQMRHAIIIAAAPKLTAQNIAFNEIARQAIISDPEFYEGRFYEHDTVPRRGLMLARMLGHITYLSDDAMRDKFGRELNGGRLGYSFDSEFQVESYLHHQGQQFVDRFDANSYLLMTKSLDYFDPAARTDGDLTRALAPATCRFLVLSFTSDWRFSPARSLEIVQALLDNHKRVTYAEIESDYGHDAFLLPIPQYLSAFGAYMERVAAELGGPERAA